MIDRRRAIQLLAPGLVVGVCMGFASACATRVASVGAEQLGTSIRGASTYAEVLPDVREELSPASGLPEIESQEPAVDDDEEHQVAAEAREKEVGPSSAQPSLGGDPTADASSGKPSPRNAPFCPDIAAYIISVFDEARHSVATLSSDPNRQGTRRREGQRFGDYRVVEIAFNRRHMSSAVWLERDGEICQVQLREEHPKRQRSQRMAVIRQQRKAAAERRRERARKARAKRTRTRK